MTHIKKINILSKKFQGSPKGFFLLSCMDKLVFGTTVNSYRG